jgi:hypothetical protein
MTQRKANSIFCAHLRRQFDYWFANSLKKKIPTCWGADVQRDFFIYLHFVHFLSFKTLVVGLSTEIIKLA